MPDFELKSNLSIAGEKLKIAGARPYWAEGRLSGNTVDFANSNPAMIKILLKFLREICGINAERLGLYLYFYDYQDRTKIAHRGSTITNIPIEQFTKPHIRKGGLNISKRRLAYGLVHIRYNHKKLLGIIDRWIKEYRNNVLNWAGTQVAKGGRLSKGSVLLKGRMEK